MSIKKQVQEYLSERPHKTGETIRYEWFIFQISKSGRPPEIESLDFKSMASFTNDFSEAERIHALQNDTLRRIGRNGQECNLRQSALVSMNYSPGRTGVFLQRGAMTDGNDSGWYVGVFDDPLSMDDPASFTRKSLYELTIHDMRMAPYWLLPAGTVINVAKGELIR